MGVAKSTKSVVEDNNRKSLRPPILKHVSFSAYSVDMASGIHRLSTLYYIEYGLIPEAASIKRYSKA